MAEDKPTWVHTQYVKAGPYEEGWPKQELTASINPILDWVEITVSQRSTGMLIRIPKSEFEDWLKKCQEEIATPSFPPNPVDSK